MLFSSGKVGQKWCRKLIGWSIDILNESMDSAVLQSIEDISFIKTLQKVNRQTFRKRAAMNYGCGVESERAEDIRVSQSPEVSEKMLTSSFQRHAARSCEGKVLNMKTGDLHLQRRGENGVCLRILFPHWIHVCEYYELIMEENGFNETIWNSADTCAFKQQMSVLVTEDH